MLDGIAKSRTRKLCRITFQKVGEGIATVIQTIMTALSTLKNKIKEKFESANFELFHSLLERIHERMAQVGEAAGEMKSGIIVALRQSEVASLKSLANSAAP